MLVVSRKPSLWGLDNSGNQLPNFSRGGLLASAALGTQTATLAAGIGWTDLTNALNALDPAYQNDNTLG
jgi:hypothetical protein